MHSSTTTTSAPEDDITDYCGQVCGGGFCGSRPVCQYGIDTESHMPRIAKLYPFNPGDYDRISLRSAMHGPCRYFLNSGSY